MPHDRLSVLTALERQGVIPVFYHPDPEVCAAVIRACARGGAPMVEFTNRGDFALDLFRDLARAFAASDPEIVLGIGSIVDAPTAALFLAAGARFVVGPTLNPEVARLCNRRLVAYAPGCGSATEISEAQALGCEIVKMFPGSSVGGPEFVKAVLAPMPWTKIMPTSGVGLDRESLAQWFGAGAVAVGAGSQLITARAIAERDWAGIEADVRAVVETVAEVRGRRS